MTAVARPPIGVDDLYTTPPGGVLAVASPGVLADDSDSAGRPLAAVVDQPPAHGAITLRPDGGFRYATDPGFVGVDQFSYRPVDGAGQVAVVVAQINVVAAPPVDSGGPRVLAIRRSGFYSQPTIYTLTFDRALDAASAANPANYTLRGRGARRAVRHRRRHDLRPASGQLRPLDPRLHSHPARQRTIRPTDAIQVNGTTAGRLTDAAERPLDGQRSGGSGTNSTGITTQADLAGFSVAPPPARRHAVVHPALANPPARVKVHAVAVHRPTR